jgi:ribosomal protein S6--L-glutamate ligase
MITKKIRNKTSSFKKDVIGWKEWFRLDCLGLSAIKGKIDTGAKTSSLHAFNIENFYIEDVEYVKFDVHPLQKNKKLARRCITRVIDRRMVSDSSGRKEKRFVIKSILCIGDKEFRIELTLANRDSMAFRMLLGRDAVKQLGMIVDPSKSFAQGKIKSSKILELYRQTKQTKDPRN